MIVDNDPSRLDAERLVRFSDRGPAYAVHLSCGESSIVQVIKHRRATGRHPYQTEYRQTIKPDSNNWKRAVRLAREAKAAEPKEVVIEVSDHGTVVGFNPLTKDADALLHSISTDPYQWMGNVLYLDHRAAQSFIEQVSDNGGKFVGAH